jgi:RES domain
MAISCALRYSWEAFSELVKHGTRFVFFRLSTPDLGPGESEPYEFLDSLRNTVVEANLVRTIELRQKWFRAHRHPPTEILSGAARLGTPPPKFASHNRMSPAGISMLYASGDCATAVAEIRSGTPSHDIFTVAEFENTRELRILDLSTIEAVPSLFDPERRHMRMALIFLRHFAEEISRPISEIEKPYEYVPTQVMTEYFRHLFHQPREIRLPPFPLPLEDVSASHSPPSTYIETYPQLDGIAFRSSKQLGGVNYTLFIEPEMCGNSATESGIVMLLTGSARQS